MLDYIIIGSGLAGISFAEVALKNNKSILVIDDKSKVSSIVAGGLYNPVILKRFSEVWNAEEQLVLMEEFYNQIETKLQVKVNFKLPILRKFFSIEEQNNWFSASDKPLLSPFLSTKLIFKKYFGIDSPFDYGEVLNTGYVDTALLLDKYQEYLIGQEQLLQESFQYDKLITNNDFVQYKDFQARNVIFAEGFGMHSNPFFQNLPLDGTKGELFIIKAPELALDVIVNTSVFILPLGNNLFKVGATYNWKDKTDTVTEEGKTELVERIKEILNCDFEVVSHFGGVRPTVRDRRPIIGTHYEHESLHLLNGLGTRGVMLGPAMAKDLFDFIENKKPLDPVIDIQRFYKKRK
ncbi:NAD(P)/FAD-dependent oxidoreductase [Flavobacterium sp. W22_SRS_FK3]|uniref:NAD(P)/FAD-dependent oxidoreductase n=1 Tax=Flavobacterium sp. W22_SRS_FK3 TaxID=3240275 RepID=UPI003F8F0B36